MSDLKNKVVSNFMVMGGSNAFSQMVTWIVTIVVARILNPADYGLFAMAGIYFGFVEFVNEFGIVAAIIHHKELSESKIRGTYTVSILFSLVISVITLGFGPLVAYFFQEPRLEKIVYALSFIFITNCMKNMQVALMIREMRFKEMARIEVMARIVSSLITLVCALAGYGVWSLIICYFAYSLLQALLYSCYERRLPGRIDSWDDIKDIIQYGFHVMSARIVGYFSNRVDTLIIGKMIGADVLGGYSFAMNLSNLPIDKLMSIFNQVLFPVFAKAQDDLEKFKSYFIKTIQVQMLVMLPVFAIMGLSADYLIPVMLGDKWSNAILPLKVFSAIGIFQYLRSFMTMLTNSMGIPRAQVNFNLLALIVTSGSMVICGYFWKLDGILLALLTVYPVLTLGYLSYLLRNMGLHFSDVLLVTAKPLFAIVVTILMVKLVQQLPLHNNISLLGATLSVGAASYLLVLAVIARDSLKEVVGLIFSRGAREKTL